jgi:2-polyprenyl-3-methyl-5-hydroxy-6-metoxy-1,4-benzoquinol methylase
MSKKTGSNFKYTGSELEMFSLATNWKNYWLKSFNLTPKKNVLEVGGGIGSNIYFIAKKSTENYILIEPDKTNYEIIKQKASRYLMNSRIKVFNGNIHDFFSYKKILFDYIFYIDVLEHIEDDKNEICKALAYLELEGILCLILPAHSYLFSKFDLSVGHFRRYNKQDIQELIPEGYIIREMKYLDSVGYFFSLINKVMLNKSNPSKYEILIWDKIFIPLSKIIDKIIFHKIGKSLMLKIGRK